MSTTERSGLLNREITHHDKAVADVLSPTPTEADFIARAQAIWGDKPQGSSLSALVDEDRERDRVSSAQKMLEILALAPRSEPDEHDRIE